MTDFQLNINQYNVQITNIMLEERRQLCVMLVGQVDSLYFFYI